MTTLEAQLEGISDGPDHLEKVVVTRHFVRAVLAKLVELKAEANARKVCDCCEQIPVFQIPERDDGAHAPRMFAAIARFNAVGEV